MNYKIVYTDLFIEKQKIIKERFKNNYKELKDNIKVFKKGIFNGQIVEKFLFDVLDVDLGRAGLQRLVMHDGEFVALADIGAASDDFAAVIMLFEPRDDDGGIKTAGICENDFFDFVCHSE